MAGKASPEVPLSLRQYELLSSYGQTGKIGIRMWRRIQLILRGSNGESNFFISKNISLGVEEVAKWRKRWGIKYELLQLFEEGVSGKVVSDKLLLLKMLEILSDEPRSGAPCTFTLAQKKEIITLACKKPEDYGIIKNDWTYDDLAQVAQEQGIVESITGRYIGDILKK